MAKSKQSRRNRINRRHNSPTGKRKGMGQWLKTRHRIRKKMMGG